MYYSLVNGQLQDVHFEVSIGDWLGIVSNSTVTTNSLPVSRANLQERIKEASASQKGPWFNSTRHRPSLMRNRIMAYSPRKGMGTNANGDWFPLFK